MWLLGIRRIRSSVCRPLRTARNRSLADKTVQRTVQRYSSALSRKRAAAAETRRGRCFVTRQVLTEGGSPNVGCHRRPMSDRPARAGRSPIAGGSYSAFNAVLRSGVVDAFERSAAKLAARRERCRAALGVPGSGDSHAAGHRSW